LGAGAGASAFDGFLAAALFLEKLLAVFLGEFLEEFFGGFLPALLEDVFDVALPLGAPDFFEAVARLAVPVDADFARGYVSFQSVQFSSAMT
jgi:hypothetical protein